MAAPWPRALCVYRELMRTLQKWPSVRRGRVAMEVRDEFRLNRLETQPEKQQKMLDEAEAGLRSLRQQCGLSAGTDVAFACDQELQHRQRG
jgi:hypothetical protein